MHYHNVAEARQHTGLRLALTAGFPGPWSEAAKSIFYVKGLEYVPVRQEAARANEELHAWTGHRNAPVVMYAEEPPKTLPEQIILLAERLAPEPRLIPATVEQRAQMFGLIRELAGELGLGWSRRVFMLKPGAAKVSADQPTNLLVQDYGYGFAHESEAVQRTAEIMQAFSARLRLQHEAGKRYLLGDDLTALDIYWATFAVMFKPMPPDLCPMPDAVRPIYENYPEQVRAATDELLFEHRDFIYQTHLQLPMDF